MTNVPLHRDVFLSLLALDSYNRGYGANVNLTGDRLGTARIRTRESDGIAQADYERWQAAGFYAIAYEWNGERVISYRGTNFPQGAGVAELIAFIDKDFGGGWSIFTGLGSNSHAHYAREFFKAVTGNDFVSSLEDPIASAVTLTGHSLGGALAGYAASRTFVDAVVFNPVPFGGQAYADAITEAFAATLAEFDISASDMQTWLSTAGLIALDAFMPGRSILWQQFADRLADNIQERTPFFGHTQGYFLEGEIAAGIDVLQAGIGAGLTALTPPTSSFSLVGLQLLARSVMNSISGDRAGIVAVDDRGVNPGLVDAAAHHAMSRLSMMLFGQKQWHSEGGRQDWQKAAKHVFDSADDEELGEALGLSRGTGGADAGSQMAAMIAYSAINQGERVFGDTGVRALFNDMDDLGAAAEKLPPLITEEVRDHLGRVVAEYAGLLAANKVLAAGLPNATQGILRHDKDSNRSIGVDLTDETWSAGRGPGNTHESIAAEGLVQDLLTAALSETLDGLQQTFVYGRLIEWLNQHLGEGSEDVYDDIDFITVSLSPEVLFDTVESKKRQLIIGTESAEEFTFESMDSSAVVMAGGGDNIIWGTEKDDAILAGQGNDELVGGVGDDWFFSGSGVNTIYGDNKDLSGGEGFVDTVVYADPGTLIVRYIGEQADPRVIIGGNGGNDTLHGIEHVTVRANLAQFDLQGTIAADTNLTVESVGPGELVGRAKQIVNGRRLQHGFTAALNKADGSSQLANSDNGGVIALVGFNTEIMGSDYDDTISDGSDEDKVIDGGAGNDAIDLSGTNAGAVIFGGAGSDWIVGSDVDDYIIDELDFSSRAREVPTPHIRAGAGDDVIVVKSAQPVRTNRFGWWQDGFNWYTTPNDALDPAPIIMNPGKGDDTVVLDMNVGAPDYHYAPGDGRDRVTLGGYSSAAYVYNYLRVPPGINVGGLHHPVPLFVLDQYHSSQVSASFKITHQAPISENLPNKDFPPLWELKGTLTLSFADGGSIEVAGLRGFWSDPGGTGMGKSPSGELRYGGFGAVGLSLFISTSDGQNEVPIHISLGQAALRGGSAPSLQMLSSGLLEPNSVQKNSEAAVSSDADQDVFLAPGEQSVIGGAGHDRVVVTWDLDAISASFADGQLIVEDAWGLIGRTIVTNFDDVYSLAEDVSYTPEAFAEAISVRFRPQQPIQGTPEDDILSGTAISDFILGLEGDDHLSGGDGDDQLDGGREHDLLIGDDGDDLLFGRSGNDTLVGGNGDDRLDGGEGADQLAGGAGHDTYEIDSLVDHVVEASDEGVDTVNAWVNYTLTEHIENLVLLGYAQQGSGNDLANHIVGNWYDDALYGFGGDDVIEGEGGYDLIVGGSGNDRLLGGRGEDTFVDGLGDDLYVGRGSTSPAQVGTEIDFSEDSADDVDTVQLLGSSTDYAIHALGAGWFRLQHLNGTGENDLVVNIDKLLFENGEELWIGPSDLNNAPILTSKFADVTINEDSAFTFTLPTDAFADPDGDALTLSATLANGDPLPNWIAFDGSSFAGTPPANFNGVLDVVVTASDGALAAQGGFELRVAPVNDAPTGIALSNASTPENAMAGTLVGTLSALDPDGGDAHSFAIAEASLRLDQALLLDPRASIAVAFGGTDAGIQNTGLRLTSMGRYEGRQGQGAYTVWRVRNATGEAQSLRLEGSQNHFSQTFAVAAMTDTFILSSDIAGSATHRLFRGPTLVDTKAASPTAFTSSQPVSLANSLFRIDGDKLLVASGAQLDFERLPAIDLLVTATDSAGASTTRAITISLTDTEDYNIVLGTGAANTMIGTAFADDLRGLEGNDTLTGHGGNDLLGGGTGTDVAMFAGVRASYALVTQNGTLTIRDTLPGADGDTGTDTLASVEQLRFKNNETLNVASPIVLDLSGDGVETVSAVKSEARFDLDGDGLADDTSRIGAGDAFLYLDRDANGTVSGVAEISFVDDVPGAASDLAGLAAFDSDKNGKLDAKDARFAEFGVWRDADGDGAVDEGEVALLKQAGIASIDLAGKPVQATTQLGEVAVVNTGSFTLANGQKRELADAALTYFSAASHMPTLATTTYDFGRKASKFGLTIAAGSIAVGERRPKQPVDPLAGQLGANTVLSFRGAAHGMFALLALDLDGDGLELASAKKARARFDYGGDGAADNTGWVKGDDGFLVIDRNGDGLIADAAELSLAAEHADARSGLQGLARLDSNGDGVVDDKDARFGELRVWQDRNGNGVTDAGELRTLAEAGLVSVRLTATAAQSQVKLGGNAVVATASFVRTNGTTGTAGDVSLAYKPAAHNKTAATSLLAPALLRLGIEPPRLDRNDGFAGHAMPHRDAVFDMLREGRREALSALFDLPDTMTGGGDVPTLLQTQDEPGMRRWLPTPDDAASLGEAAVSDPSEDAMQRTQDLPRTLRKLTEADDAALLRPGSPGGQDADLARRLMLIRQDMGAFGAAGAGTLDRLHALPYGVGEFHA